MKLIAAYAITNTTTNHGLPPAQPSSAVAMSGVRALEAIPENC